MSKSNHALGISFNDNSGAMGFFANSQGIYDHKKYVDKYGKWRVRFKYLRRFWIAIKTMERMAKEYK